MGCGGPLAVTVARARVDADPAATGTDAYTPMLAVAPGAAARLRHPRGRHRGLYGGPVGGPARTGGSEPDHKGVGIQEGPGRIA